MFGSPPDNETCQERNEMHRAEYRVRIAENYSPEQLVFVDESACDRRTYLRIELGPLKGFVPAGSKSSLEEGGYVKSGGWQ